MPPVPRDAAPDDVPIVRTVGAPAAEVTTIENTEFMPVEAHTPIVNSVQLNEQPEIRGSPAAMISSPGAPPGALPLALLPAAPGPTAHSADAADDGSNDGGEAPSL